MRSILVLAMLAACSSTASSDPKSEDPPADPDEPLPVNAEGRRDTFTPSQYAAHIKLLRAKLDKHGLGKLHVRIEDPFVVIGDGTPAQLERNATTVRWAADKLERDFFTKRPRKILDIYLFTTEASYEHGVAKLTGEEPGTPYGFYSSARGAMFMNIATGGGTLVHEIVHPYVEADFPDAPPWLNEGLGSLFEQSAERDGRIVGLTNWRLAGLQKSIRRGRVPSFRSLTKLATDEFYGDETGTNYAQSRYLMYYLQEQGVLRDFYRAFRAQRKQDPTGYATLVRTLEVKDMTAFQAQWERYVAALRFP